MKGRQLHNGKMELSGASRGATIADARGRRSAANERRCARNERLVSVCVRSDEEEKSGPAAPP